MLDIKQARSPGTSCDLAAKLSPGSKFLLFTVSFSIFLFWFKAR